MQFDVVALGELLIDFTPAGQAPSGGALFEQNPGGAPANVLVALAKLGGHGAFIGKVGSDQFGTFLKNVLESHGVSAQGLRFTPDASTTLAFVHLDARGNRSFSFCRKPGADILLEASDVDRTLIDQCRVFHFGSLSLTDEPARTATLHAVRHAKATGKIISFDPNWRPPLWKDDATAKAGMTAGLADADILKVSESELEILTGEKDIGRAVKHLFERGIKIVLATLGPDGCYFQCRDGHGHVPCFPVTVVDTTGAGDAFLGGFLYQFLLTQEKPEELVVTELTEMVRFSNAVGSLCTTRKGAISAMPSLEEVTFLLAADQSVPSSRRSSPLSVNPGDSPPVVG
jgi:fructokinase